MERSCFLPAVLLLLLGGFGTILSSSGCGGGGTGGGNGTGGSNGGGSTMNNASPSPNPTPTPTPTPLPTSQPRFAVAWGARSRGTVAVNALSSPLSFVLTISNGHVPDNAAIRFTGARPDTTNPVTTSYVATDAAYVGRSAAFTIDFYSGANGDGDVVATASGSAQVETDGTVTFNGGATTITPTGRVRRVTVTPNQQFAVGQTKDLDVTARDADGRVLAVTPGSLFVSPASATDAARIASANGGSQLRGTAPGQSFVVATIDSVSSESVAVRVSSDTTVTVTPSPLTLSVMDTTLLSAVVGGSNPTNRSVQWSILEGSIGGVIDTEGRYTAPAKAGVYHIIATSFYDPSISTTVNVEVQSGGITGIIE